MLLISRLIKVFFIGLGIVPLKSFTVVALRSAYSKIAEDSERGNDF